MATNDANTLHVDHLLLGTGQATGTLLGGLGPDASVAVIEADRVGGSCVNFGCTPSKTLIGAAKIAYAVRSAADYGIGVEEPTIDGRAVLRRVDAVRSASRIGLTRFVEGRPRTTLIRGEGRFVAPRTVQVGDRTVTADVVHLCVGTRANVPPIPGLPSVPWVDAAGLFDRKELPARLAIVGGSYIGTELGQALARLGVQVTLLEVDERILPQEEAGFAREVRDLLIRDGVDVREGVTVQEARPDGEAAVLELADGEAVAADLVLIAAGRVSNADRANVQAVGIEVNEHGFVVVDDACRTTASGTYALGDVNGRGAFTHTAVHDAQVALDDLQGAARPRRISDRAPIYALFTDPPLGRFGLSAEEAVAQGIDVAVAEKPMKAIARAKEEGRTEGRIQLVIDRTSDRIVGATAFGLYGDEIANLIAAQAAAGGTREDLLRTVLIHPTVGELLPFIAAGAKPANEA